MRFPPLIVLWTTIVKVLTIALIPVAEYQGYQGLWLLGFDRKLIQNQLLARSMAAWMDLGGDSIKSV